uniref:PiggyBac transposable element-derived protein domain-containing protein n=1 Tax=Oreochromis aureus TaxID=47969 RepID=A0AAZ1XT41_OREAU
MTVNKADNISSIPIDGFSNVRITSLWTFFMSVQWSEPWLIGLLVFHAVCLFLTLLTCKYYRAQICHFLLVVGLVYSAEYLNELAARNWSRNAALVSYVPKKSRNVLLLSTKHREPQVENSGKKKPQIILDYNKCKGAVDHLDQVCGTYSCRRRTRRWPMCLLYHMIDVSCYNAFVLFTAVDTEWNKGKRYCRRLFIEQVGRALITPTMMNRSHLPRTPFAVSLVLQAQGKEQQEQQEKEEEQQEEEEEQQEEEWESPSKKRKQCASCKQRKRIITNCCKCGAPACKIHLKTLCGSCYKM